MMKQLLNVEMAFIKFIQSRQVISNSRKPSSDITCLNWVSFDILHRQ